MCQSHVEVTTIDTHIKYTHTKYNMTSSVLLHLIELFIIIDGVADAFDISRNNQKMKKKKKITDEHRKRILI